MKTDTGLQTDQSTIAVVLMIEGYSADEAIALIREKRDPNALFNPDFVRYLQQLSIQQAS